MMYNFIELKKEINNLTIIVGCFSTPLLFRPNKHIQNMPRNNRMYIVLMCT